MHVHMRVSRMICILHIVLFAWVTCENELSAEGLEHMTNRDKILSACTCAHADAFYHLHTAFLYVLMIL